MFQQGKCSWIAFGQNVTIVEKPQMLSDIEQPKKKIPICKEIIDGLFTEKQLKESQTAQMYRHSRRRIREEKFSWAQVESIHTNSHSPLTY